MKCDNCGEEIEDDEKYVEGRKVFSSDGYLLHEEHTVHKACFREYAMKRMDDLEEKIANLRIG